ncbi:VOC family protein [Paenibacillus thermotolerans]|uniref:VOC family protein n=1 Tax=Paenibacillus thermotolerans TaxID=3027807 RepID=UPI0023684C08|nr:MULTISPECIES: VOC family protein [unclassified Paenibacillus]
MVEHANNQSLNRLSKFDGYKPNVVPNSLKLIRGNLYEEPKEDGISMTEQSTALFNGKVTLWQYVEDLDKAVQWYQEVLGLKYAHDIGLAYFFTINEYTELAVSDLYMGEETKGNCPRSVMLDLTSDDIVRTHRELISKGVRVEEEIQNPAKNYHEFYFWDLEGNQIRVSGFVN